MELIDDLPSDLLRRAEMAAAQRHTTVKQLVIEAVEKLLDSPPPATPVQLTPVQAEIFEIDAYGIPVLKKRGRVMTNEMINQMREELGI